jgi:hypothetical protein
MIIHREIRLSYLQNPIAQGVNYSPLVVESKEEALVKEERWPKEIRQRFPVQSSSSDWQQPLFRVFHVSPPPPLGNAQEGPLNSLF